MCEICYGIGICPVCSDDIEYEVCPRCGGSGKIYLNDDYEEITKEMYNARSKNHRFAEKCEFCDGEGEINFENENITN